MDIDALRKAMRIVNVPQKKILCSHKVAHIIRTEAPELANCVVETSLLGDDFVYVIDDPNINNLVREELFIFIEENDNDKS